MYGMYVCRWKSIGKPRYRGAQGEVEILEDPGKRDESFEKELAFSRAYEEMENEQVGRQVGR